MPIVKDGRIVDDPWSRLDSESIPDDTGPVLLTLAQWRAHADSLRDGPTPLGLILEGSDPLDEVADDLDRVDLIALVFPKFTDGRAYSLARLLRQRHGYVGELRAVGNVLRDQFLHMQRCGIDSAEVADASAADAWASATGRYRAYYQPAVRGRSVGRGSRQRPAVVTNGAPVEYRPETRPGASGYTAASWAY